MDQRSKLRTPYDSATMTGLSNASSLPPKARQGSRYAVWSPPSSSVSAASDVSMETSDEDYSADSHTRGCGRCSGSSSSLKGKRSRSTIEEHRVRRGKWTHEESAYADRLIQDFEAGLLPLENGATLRAFLSKKLNCDPVGTFSL